MFSIIIPVFNAEKYLKQCIKSVLDQNYQEFEILLINDGSNDNSLNIIMQFQDERIVLINKENTGVSDSRNIGISKAKFPYILFVDADDYIYPNLLADISKEIEKSTLLIFGFMTSNKVYQLENKVLSKTQYSIDLNLYIKNMTFSQVWNKVYERKIILDNNIKFTKNLSLGEDCIFNIDYLRNVNNVKTLNKEYYFYNVETQCLTKKLREDHFEIHLTIYNHFKKFYIENNLSAGLADEFLIKSFYGYVTALYFHKVKYKKKLIISKMSTELLNASKKNRDNKMYKILKFLIRHRFIYMIKFIGFFNNKKKRV